MGGEGWARGEGAGREEDGGVRAWTVVSVEPNTIPPGRTLPRGIGLCSRAIGLSSRTPHEIMVMAIVCPRLCPNWPIGIGPIAALVPFSATQPAMDGVLEYEWSWGESPEVKRSVGEAAVVECIGGRGPTYSMFEKSTSLRYVCYQWPDATFTFAKL